MKITMTIPRKEVVTLSKKEAVLFNMYPGNAGGGGSGDMTKEVYDPTGKEADAFSMGNMDETGDAKIMTAEERLAIVAAYEHSQSQHADPAATPQRGVAVFVQEIEPGDARENDIWIQI